MDQSQLYAFYARDPDPIVRFLDYLRDLYRLPRPGAVLDMGCGPGHLLAPLASADWVVTGYEPDPEYAAAAQQQMQGAGQVRIHQGGFLDLNEVQTFDLIAAVNGPYCYVLDPASRREALRRCARALRPGGVLFLEVSNFYWILKNYQRSPAIEMEVGGNQVTRTAQHDIDYHRGTFTHHDRFTWLDASGIAQVVTKTHPMAIVSFTEIEFFLEESGFEEVCTFNKFTDRAPGKLTGGKILAAARVASRRAS